MAGKNGGMSVNSLIHMTPIPRTNLSKADPGVIA